MPGTTELIVILVIVLVLFGGSKIPQIMGGFGKGIKNFKNAINDELDDNDDSIKLEAKDDVKRIKEGKEV